MNYIYMSTIFVSAVLLFTVQPMSAKFMLPSLGGGSSVWAVCVMFFQIALLGGYSYAHLLDHKVPFRKQTYVHSIVLLLSLVFIPLPLAAFTSKLDHIDPTLSILTTLFMTVGLPYFVLSSTSTLMQAWYRNTHSGKTPYKLYSISNLGSVIGLLSFPFLIEANLPSDAQVTYWSIGYGIYIALILAAIITINLKYRSTTVYYDNLPPSSTSTETSYLQWTLLPAIASFTLIAVTNFITGEISSTPFLWIAPLLVYLISFILVFHNEKLYNRATYYIYGCASVSLSFILYAHSAYSIMMVATLIATLFIVSMICHGEVVHSRPSPSRLAVFYLLMTLGGAIGGIMASLVIPMISTSVVELPAALIGFSSVLLYKFFTQRVPRETANNLSTALLVLGMVLGTAYMQIINSDFTIIDRSRNFYGALSVKERPLIGNDINLRVFSHGNTLHGFQLYDGNKHSPINTPTAYYTKSTLLGRYFESQKENKIRIAALGLGIGVLAYYGKQDDVIDFYEINPNVTRVARDYFGYINSTKAEVNVEHGDARINLENKEPQNYSAIILDAFNGDSVPTHLLTTEAFDVYLKHLKDNGYILINISNRHLDLRGVVSSVAASKGLSTVIKVNPAIVDENSFEATWVAISRDPLLLSSIYSEMLPSTLSDSTNLWTDNYSSLLHVLSLSGSRE